MYRRYCRQTGVSPVVAVILMVAVTVLLSTAIGALVFDIAPSKSDDGTQTAGVRMVEEGDGLRVTAISVENADELRVVRNGVVVETFTGDITGQSTLLTDLQTDDTVSVITVVDGSETVVSSHTVSAGLVSRLTPPMPSGGVWAQPGQNSLNTGQMSQLGPRSDAQLNWSFSTPDARIRDSAAAADGTVFVASSPSCSPCSGNLTALNLSTGTSLWSYTTTDGIISPVYEDGTIFIHDATGDLIALDAADGTVQWKITLSSDANGGDMAVKNGVLYITLKSDTTYAINTADGSEKWNTSVSGFSFNAPTVAGGVVFVGTDCGTDCGKVHALDATDGSKLWSNAYNARAGAPTYDSDIVYVPLRDGTSSAAGDVVALNASDGTQVWRVATGSSDAFHTSVGHGQVYVSHGSSLSALAPTDGASLWTHSAGSWTTGKPALSENTVYYGSNDNTIYGINPDDGAELWQHGTADGIWMSGMVVDGRVIYGDDSATMYAINGTLENP